ncbi:hypothetical protein QOT17_019924 [Balamuthia mandrillaris]
MRDDNKCNAQHWDDLSPAELRLLIKKEQASIQHLKTVHEDEIFIQPMATKWELNSVEQHIQELEYVLQQAEQRDPQYLSKRLDSLEHQTSNIPYLVEAVDVLLVRINKAVFECYETIVINTITHRQAI